MDKFVNPQLEDAVDRALEMLDTGSYVPGDPFFSPVQLAEKLQIAPELAGRVLEQLETLVRLDRRGDRYVIAPPPVVRNTWAMSSLSAALAERGYPLTSRVLFFGSVEAPKAASAMLELPLGEKVYLLHRVRSSRGLPMALEQSYLPVSRFPGLMEYDFAARSLYQTLEEKYQTRAASQALEFFVEEPSPEESRLLALAPGEPVLLTVGKTCSPSGRVFEYSLSRAPARRTVNECRPELRGKL